VTPLEIAQHVDLIQGISDYPLCKYTLYRKKKTTRFNTILLLNSSKKACSTKIQ